MDAELKAFLDERAATYNRPTFIENDPIVIPHSFTKKQDIEIAAFFAATLAWGQRITIINKCRELMNRMDNAPHEFMLHHTATDRKVFKTFKHRTFNSEDCLYFIRVLGNHYRKNSSLESVFAIDRGEETVEQALIQFHTYFFSLKNSPSRTTKHLATPEKKSACKRMNMFLRWMVRKDKAGVDFGIWKTLSPAQLVCPCDLHVERVARKLRLITRKPLDWTTALELTRNLRRFDPEDPVKYDFALFGLGVVEKF